MRRLLPALRPRLLPRAIVAAACAWALLVAAVLGAGSSSAIPDPSFGNSNKGLYPSLRLDGSGNPVVAYFNATNGDLKLLHCAVASCEGAGASISSPDTADTTGLYPSLRLDAAGNPAASYYEQSNGNLRLMRCNDPNCAGADESLVTVDAPGDVGQFTSLALDAAGRPVAAYYDATGGNLKVAHCNDANCAGDNESITAPATAGDVGRYASLALDSNGWPVVSYYNATSKTVTVTHCNDANCAGNNESNATPDSSPIDAGVIGTSLALDSGGRPVVAYFEDTNGALRLVHCNDTNCAGGDESISVVDSTGRVGLYPSLTLDAASHPAIAYFQFSGSDLKVAHCNDVNCAAGDESVLTVNAVGETGLYPSLVLAASTIPVVAFYDLSNHTLRVLNCGDATCAGVKDVGGVTELTGVTGNHGGPGAHWLLTLSTAALMSTGVLLRARRRAWSSRPGSITRMPGNPRR